jgi:aromatic-L-amino-acid decarboxylase
MRHRVAGRKLGRTSEHRTALLRNLSTALFWREKVRTTLAKAKELRPFAEKLVTLSKKETLHARRLVLRHIHDRAVVADVKPGEIRAMVADQAPEAGESMEAILGDLDRVVMPGITHWQHPGWFAYFPASSSPASILGEMAAAGLAVQGMMWSTSPAATEIESAVLDWLVDLMGLPRSWRIDPGPGGGSLQMSASDSTHVSLVVARRLATEAGAATDDLVAYGSQQAHSSIEKGGRVAGFRHIRSIEVDDVYAMRPDSLERAIESDLAAGLVPTWVCSTIGTTGTTAVDPVAEIAEIAVERALWHHVDAAYAGSAMLCPEMRHFQDGVDLVDSYTFNPHKWLLTNFDCSAFWVADRSKLIETLSIQPPYLRDSASDSGEVVDYRDWHVPLGRRFRSLKLWFVLRSYGAEGLRRHIRGHIDLASQLTEKVAADQRLDLVAPTTFGLVSFRHRAGNQATNDLAAAINATGDCYVTQSLVDDRPFIRVSIGSTWTTPAHVDALWSAIDELA